MNLTSPRCSALVGILSIGWFAAIAGGIARAEDSLWQNDFAAAKAQAKAEKKYIVLGFTGSDWCGSCIELKKAVFDVPAFQAAATKQFVLVEVDFPNKKEQSQELINQNQTLSKFYEYRGGGLPTVLVLDAEGNVVTRTGNLGIGPEAYMQHLTEIVERHESVPKMKAELATAQGLDRAKLLDRMVEAVTRLHNEDPWETFVPCFPALDEELGNLGMHISNARLAPLVAARYGLSNHAETLECAKLAEWATKTRDRLETEQNELDAWSQEIPSLDPDNEAGLKVKYELRNLVVEAARSQWYFEWGQFYEPQKLLARAVELPGLTGEQKQWAYFRQGLAVIHKSRYEDAVAPFEKSIASTPDSPHVAHIKQFLELAVKQTAERKAEVEKLRADLKKATGSERLQALNEIIEFSYWRDGTFSVAELEAWYRELVELDTDHQCRCTASCDRDLRRDSVGYVNLFCQQKYAEACTACDKALTKVGLSADDISATYYWKALCCHAQDDFQGCLDCVQKAFETCPNGGYKDNLKGLRQRAEKDLKEQNKDNQKP